MLMQMHRAQFAGQSVPPSSPMEGFAEPPQREKNAREQKAQLREVMAVTADNEILKFNGSDVIMHTGWTNGCNEIDKS